MAGGQERILRRRIKSVESTKKITRAMELIAASRIVKAQARVHAAQPYAEGITDVVRNLQGAGGASNSALLTPRDEVRKVANIVIAADRGLCGGYNSTVIRAAEHDMRDQERAGRENALVHRRPQGRGLLPLPRLPDRRRATPGSATAPPTRTPAPSRQPSSRGFEAGELDRVQLVYTRFISAGRQEVVVEPLLPLEPRGRRRAADAARRASRAPTTSSNRTPKPFSRRCCRATRSRVSTRRC